MSRTDTQVLAEILPLFERSIADYNSIAAETRERLDRIANERVALGTLRSRVLAMHETARAWDLQVWNLGFSEVDREARTSAQTQVRAHINSLDALAWELFEFRERLQLQDLVRAQHASTEPGGLNRER